MAKVSITIKDENGAVKALSAVRNGPFSFTRARTAKEIPSHLRQTQ